MAGCGGSVSRRDHNQAVGPHLTGGTKLEETSQPKRQPLFGREGSGGRGASLREAASPPRSFSPSKEYLFERGCGGERFSIEKRSPPHPLSKRYSLEGLKLLGGEAASLREAPLPPDPSLPKSGWRLGWDVSSSLVPPVRWGPTAWLWSRRLTEPPQPAIVEYERELRGGGGFSERSSATSIGAAYGRLFRLRKTAMLSRHWRLWLSFPSPPDPLSRRAASV